MVQTALQGLLIASSHGMAPRTWTPAYFSPTGDWGCTIQVLWVTQTPWVLSKERGGQVTSLQKPGDAGQWSVLASHVTRPHCGREALTRYPVYSPFQRGDTFMPASGPPGSKASTGLPGSVPMPRLVLSLPSALRIPAIISLSPRRKRGNLKAIIEDAESKLAVPLRQRKQVLVHTLWGRCSEAATYHDSEGRRYGKQPSGLGRAPSSTGQGRTWGLGTLTHLKWLPILVGGGCGGGRAVFCVPGEREPVNCS